MVHIDVFQALADPTRRQIVQALGRGEQHVNDVVSKTEIHQSGVSRHLRILHEAGLVLVRPDGQKRLYSLREEPFRELEGWLAAFHGLWEARLDRFGCALAAKQEARTRTATSNKITSSKATSKKAKPKGRKS